MFLNNADTMTSCKHANILGANVQATFEIMQHSIPHLKLSSSEQARMQGGKWHRHEMYPNVVLIVSMLYLQNVAPSIINISSVNAKQAFKGCATYCASKAAVDQLSRCASLVCKTGVYYTTLHHITLRYTSLHFITRHDTAPRYTTPYSSSLV